MFYFIFNRDQERIVPAIIISGREEYLPPNSNGNVIKENVDDILSQITLNSLFYKIQNESGNLGGFFVLNVNKPNQSVSLYIVRLRSAYQQYSSDINQQINTFITDGSWKRDYLF